MSKRPSAIAIVAVGVVLIIVASSRPVSLDIPTVSRGGRSASRSFPSPECRCPPPRARLIGSLSGESVCERTTNCGR